MNEFLFPFERMLAQVATPDAVRAIEHGEAAGGMWQAFEESGFLDALVPVERDGVGLLPADVHPLWQAIGRHAVPLPVGETMIARALLDRAPPGPIALAVGAPGQDVIVPNGMTASHVLLETEGELYLMDAGGGPREHTGVAASLSARMRWGTLPPPAAAAPAGGLRRLSAVLRAALIAGAADRLTMMSASYANERIQFGKAIGRQQALQQQLAVMAEETVAARIASQLGCGGAWPPGLASAAAAKSVASAVAARIAATAHAVHGAIGISEEHDLQLFTRRLHEWRLADGSEAYWNRLLGAARLSDVSASIDFVRAQVALDPA